MESKNNSKPTFQKMKLYGKCWFYPCQTRADGVLNFVDGSEVRVCWSCARKRAKIRRFRKDKGISKPKYKQLVLSNPPVRNVTEKPVMAINGVSNV